MHKSIFPILLSLICFFGFATSSMAQDRDPDAGKTVAQVEKELAVLASAILKGDSTDLKIEQNKTFIRRMTFLLKRPESYNHPFDSLKTISRLRPEDDSFRIFTWYFIDKSSNAFYAEAAHYHFGLVQRKFIGVNGTVHYLVIPLMEMEILPKGIENTVTDNYSWFGALYYPPKNSPFIDSYDGFYYKLVPKKGKVEVQEGKKADVVTFVPGRYKQRMVTQGEMLNFSTMDRVKQDVRYYLLMGWNGWDNKANYKVVDVMSFDTEDSTRINFGAPIFYFENIPKARALFKYSEYASFTLNKGVAKSGFMNLGRKKMIIYDHLAPPRFSRPTDVWDMGPDGSYDGLAWYQKTGGYFEWYRTVETVDKEGGKRHRKEMEKLQLEYAKQDTTLFPDYYDLYKGKKPQKAGKATQRALNKQRKESEKRIKDSGLEMKRKEEEKAD